LLKENIPTVLRPTPRVRCDFWHAEWLEIEI
jgi:hypothetical protein